MRTTKTEQPAPGGFGGWVRSRGCKRWLRVVDGGMRPGSLCWITPEELRRK